MVKQNALPEMPFFFAPDCRALSAGFAQTYRMVPKAGLEPARDFSPGILRSLCELIPVSFQLPTSALPQ